MATLTWQRHICTSAAVADRGPAGISGHTFGAARSRLQLPRWRARALAPIDKEAESATIGRSRKATEALATQRRPSGI
jgi:hypothetical protein